MTAAWCAALVSSGVGFFLIKSRLNYERLPELPVDQAAGPATELTVIVPARDEEHNIARAVSSFPGIPVLVIDDDSRDRTAERAAQAGATVIPAPPLQNGLLGKPNACLAGARACDTPWLLFVDADTFYRPEFAPSLVAYARRENLAAVSVFLAQQRITAFERMLLPYAFALYFCGVNARRVNDRNSPEALANGQCLLFRRDAYDLTQGHAAVGSSVIEDVALARILKRHRLHTRVLRAETLGAVRMYDSLGAIWRGFQKNSFRFLLVNPWGGAQVIAASILLTSYAPVLVALLAKKHWALAAAFAALPSVLLLPWYGSPAVLLAPAAIYFFQLVALNAMLSTLFGRAAIWKGRRV